MMGGMEGTPYRCHKCKKEFANGKYLDFLNHLEVCKK